MRGHLATDVFREQRQFTSDDPVHQELKELVNQLIRPLMPWAAKRVLLKGFSDEIPGTATHR
jgi:hypothetical protein